MSENNNLYLYEEISRDIKELILSKNIKYGEQIPSVSEIRKKYNVSHLTALMVFKKLSKEGYVKCKKGRGYFVTFRQECSTSKTFASICCILRPFRETTLHDNYFNDINQAVQQELLKRKFNAVYPCCNYSFVDSNPDEDGLNSVKSTLLEFDSKTDAFIIDERIPDSLISSLRGKITKPILTLGRKSTINVDSVSPDNEKGARKAIEICLKMNYNFFCVGRNGITYSNFDERTDAFLAALKENNVPEKRIFCFDYNICPFEETALLIEKNIKPDCKTMIFSPTDYFARKLVDLFTEKGIKLGDKLGIMGFDGIEMPAAAELHLTTVNVHPSEMGIKAVEIVLSRINGTNFEKKKNYTVPATLQVGESI